MNTLLEKVIDVMVRLPERDQEALAGFILAEIENEKAWSASFEQSQDQLGELVRRAKEEVRTDGALPYDPSNRPER